MGALGAVGLTLVGIAWGGEPLYVAPPTAGYQTRVEGIALGAQVEALGMGDDCVRVRVVAGNAWIAGTASEACLPEERLTRRAPTPSSQVVAAWQVLYGGDAEQVPPDSPWGYSGLPVDHWLTPEELVAEWEREHLSTPEQRGKATAAVGPSRHGVPVYTHFTGADAPRSDIWAQPDTVVRILAIASGWFDHCASAVEPARIESCTLQIGDLAWYGPRQPDPLGHADHYQGTCVDIRLFRSDGSRYESYWNRPDDRQGMSTAYSASLNEAFLGWVLDHEAVGDLLFNDPEVGRLIPSVRPSPGHDDHIHLCLEGNR